MLPYTFDVACPICKATIPHQAIPAAKIVAVDKLERVVNYMCTRCGTLNYVDDLKKSKAEFEAAPALYEAAAQPAVPEPT